MNAMALELFLHDEIEHERERYIAKMVEQWDSIIRQALLDLGEALWPCTYYLGIIPQKPYRLQTQSTATSYTWLIERAMPPPNQNKCLAYRIHLTLDDLGQPTITVRSGSTHYPVKLLTAESLAATLAQAADDAPIIIFRKP